MRWGFSLSRTQRARTCTCREAGVSSRASCVRAATCTRRKLDQIPAVFSTRHRPSHCPPRPPSSAPSSTLRIRPPPRRRRSSRVVFSQVDKLALGHGRFLCHSACARGVCGWYQLQQWRVVVQGVEHDERLPPRSGLVPPPLRRRSGPCRSHAVRGRSEVAARNQLQCVTDNDREEATVSCLPVGAAPHQLPIRSLRKWVVLGSATPPHDFEAWRSLVHDGEELWWEGRCERLSVGRAESPASRSSPSSEAALPLLRPPA